jgi:hypothetical protein
MSKGATLVLVAIALAAFGALGGFIWFYSADVTGYSDAKGFYRYDCDDPRYLNDHACARRACLSAMKAANAVPQDYEIKPTNSWGDPARVRLEGHLRGKVDTALPPKRFSCTFEKGHVVMVTIDGAKLPVKPQ